MIAHGYSKVFGGLSEHVHHVSNLGLPGWLAYFSAAAEFFGGILVIAGLFTRFAALAILINMSVAIWKVHWKNGLLGQGGYQFPLALGAIAFALIFLGAGPIALDGRSEEHTSELQSRENLVCRLLLEKKKNRHVG